MANIRNGSIVADIRGAVGTEIYSRNAAGPYVKNRVGPGGERTSARAAVRDTIKDLSKAWSATLSGTHRATWRAYAARFPMPNRWGSQVLTNGYNYFIRCNAYRYRHATSIDFLEAPDAPPLHKPIFTFTADAAADTLTIALPPTNYSPPPNNLRLWLFGGKPQAPGVTYFRAPWRFIGQNLFSGTWSLDPWTVNHPWPIDAGQKIFSYIVAQDAEQGNLSTLFQTSTIAP